MERLDSAGDGAMCESQLQRRSAMKATKWLICFVVTLALLLVACSKQEIVDTPTPVVVSTGVQSGGLGLTRLEWLSEHGEGKKSPDGYLVYEQKYELLFSGPCAHYINVLVPDEGWTMSEAKSEAQAMLPGDAALEETYNPAGKPELTVELHKSEWLKSQCTDDAWTGGEPGEFIISYGVSGDVVKSVLIVTGNNP
jgi:hypothetical protein